MLQMRHHSFVNSEAGPSHQDREELSMPIQMLVSKAIAVSSVLTSAKEQENKSKERTREKGQVRFGPIVVSLRTDDQGSQPTGFSHGSVHWRGRDATAKPCETLYQTKEVNDLGGSREELCVLERWN